MLHLLTNENIPASVVATLRSHGHDVLSAKESLRGSADVAILTRAQQDSRILITQDKDFGELAFRRGANAQCGLILFRLQGQDPDLDMDRMVAIIESRADWTGCFVVVTDDRVRIRLLPGTINP